jgi:Cupredoxin-like domain
MCQTIFRFLIPLLFVGATIGTPTHTTAQDASPTYTPTNADGDIVLTLQNHIFSPAEIHLPAGKRTQLLVKNLDATADEFDSSALKVEKVIGGKSSGIVRLRALDKGSYPFIGEYHSDTAKGVVIAE